MLYRKCNRLKQLKAICVYLYQPIAYMYLYLYQNGRRTNKCRVFFMKLYYFCRKLMVHIIYYYNLIHASAYNIFVHSSPYYIIYYLYIRPYGQFYTIVRERMKLISLNSWCIIILLRYARMDTRAVTNIYLLLM